MNHGGHTLAASLTTLLGCRRFATDRGKRHTDGHGAADGQEDKDRDGRRDAQEQDPRRLPGSRAMLEVALRSSSTRSRMVRYAQGHIIFRAM